MDTPSPELLARFAELAATLDGPDRKLVFGCPALLHASTMFFGVHATGLLVRLDADAADELLHRGGRPFEPVPGRPMTGFFLLPPDLPDPAGWVARAYEHVRSLPPKAVSARPARGVPTAPRGRRG